jgi:TolA-binding protein
MREEIPTGSGDLEDMAVRQKVITWERHGQTIMLSIITAALLSAASILYSSNAIQASMAVEIRNLTSQVAELKGNISAMQQNYITRVEFNTHEARLQSLEQRRVGR